MKKALTAQWMDGSALNLPAALEDALARLPPAVLRSPHKYHLAMLAADTPLQHWAHVLYFVDASQALVTWTGRGVKVGSVVSSSGTLEMIKRRIEGGTISSVHAFRSAGPHRTAVLKPSRKALRSGIAEALERRPAGLALTLANKS